jgi:hypothetical protein
MSVKDNVKFYFANFSENIQIPQLARHDSGFDFDKVNLQSLKVLSISSSEILNVSNEAGAYCISSLAASERRRLRS